MKIRLLVGLVACMVLLGCVDEYPEKTLHERGYVRSLWCHYTRCTVVFERDSPAGETITYDLVEIPPLWQGEHIEFDVWLKYSPDGSVFLTKFMNVRRVE